LPYHLLLDSPPLCLLPFLILRLRFFSPLPGFLPYSGCTMLPCGLLFLGFLPRRHTTFLLPAGFCHISTAWFPAAPFCLLCVYAVFYLHCREFWVCYSVSFCVLPFCTSAATALCLGLGFLLLRVFCCVFCYRSLPLPAACASPSFPAPAPFCTCLPAAVLPLPLDSFCTFFCRYRIPAFCVLRSPATTTRSAPAVRSFSLDYCRSTVSAIRCLPHFLDLGSRRLRSAPPACRFVCFCWIPGRLCRLPSHAGYLLPACLCVALRAGFLDCRACRYVLPACCHRRRPAGGCLPFLVVSRRLLPFYHPRTGFWMGLPFPALGTTVLGCLPAACACRSACLACTCRFSAPAGTCRSAFTCLQFLLPAVWVPACLDVTTWILPFLSFHGFLPPFLPAACLPAATCLCMPLLPLPGSPRITCTCCYLPACLPAHLPPACVLPVAPFYWIACHGFIPFLPAPFLPGWNTCRSAVFLAPARCCCACWNFRSTFCRWILPACLPFLPAVLAAWILDYLRLPLRLPPLGSGSAVCLPAVPPPPAASSRFHCMRISCTLASAPACCATAHCRLDFLITCTCCLPAVLLQSALVFSAVSVYRCRSAPAAVGIFCRSPFPLPACCRFCLPATCYGLPGFGLD